MLFNLKAAASSGKQALGDFWEAGLPEMEREVPFLHFMEKGDSIGHMKGREGVVI